MIDTKRRKPGPLSSILATALAVVAAMLFASGCGSSSSSSSSTSSSSGASSGNSQADQIVAKASQRPTHIMQTQPIGKPVPAGKKITYISCGVTICAAEANITTQAAKILGWTTTTINTDGSPAQVTNAMESAIRSGTDGIVLPAANAAELAKPLADMKAKGIQFVTCCSTDPAGTYLFNTGTPQQNAQIGTTMAAQVVKDSGGKAKALFVNLPAFTILASVGVNFKSEMKTLCPSCSVDEIDIPLTSVGKDAPDRIVSYLRGHPDVNYVFLVEGALAPGVKAALTAAGLASKVKLLEQGGDPTSNQELKAGQPWLAATPSAVYGYDYSMVDALARHFAGVPVLPTPPEFWLMTSSAVPPEAISGPAFPLVPDYKAQWTKLWNK